MASGYVRVLVSAPYLQPELERFRPRLEDAGCELVVPAVHERLEEDDLLMLVADVDGVICGDDRLTERVLAAARRLKVISKWGTGVDSIDREACARRGITVCNTPDAFSIPVAESAVGYALCFARNLPAMAAQMRAGGWQKIAGRSLSECTFGIVGVGNVGKALVKLLQPFGARVLANDSRQLAPTELAAFRVEMAPLEQLLSDADFVSLHCDLNPTSHHLIGAAQLAAMKRTAVLINTARGSIVDEPALIAALEAGALAGAALDVFEHEPLAPDSPLRAMDNVLLAPHNSNSSPRAWERVHETTIHNLLAALGLE